MNERLQSLFTIVEERNSEQKYEGILQHKERLDEFVEHTTELVNFEQYGTLILIKMSFDNLTLCIRHMLMLSSSRGVMQTGLTIPSKNTACIRLDDLYHKFGLFYVWRYIRELFETTRKNAHTARG